MSIINGHTCIGDDGGTPNRTCQACEDEKRKPKSRPKAPCGLDHEGPCNVACGY